MLGGSSIFDVLRKRHPVVLLGDPGTGKSTLLNYLVWLLARPGEPTVAEKFGSWLLPVPITLRELSLEGLESWGQLMRAFMDHPMSRPLGSDKYIEQMAARGRVLFLIDGIDEVGELVVRRGLRAAVQEGFSLYPKCCWVLTSRIVGYDEVPFHVPANLKESTSRDDTGSNADIEDVSQAVDEKARHLRIEDGRVVITRRSLDRSDPDKGNSVATVRYIAPFDDQRIATFARHWYAQREAAAARAGESAQHLVRALHEDRSILRLARVPNLLTMMALIHRIETTLPHGRALLYDRIGEAYLESIDKFRGVYSGAYDFQQKRSWLARIGFELQKRRSSRGSREDGDSHLLVTKEDVILWVEDEMARHSKAQGGMSASEFLDIVGRRSGLFLPRGEGRYAFVHLSFQEYFAAVSVEQQVTSLSWAKGEKTRLGISRRKIRSWVSQNEWFETFSFLFELLAPKVDWHHELMRTAFGGARVDNRRLNKFREKPGKASNVARLMLRLVGNPRSGLPDGDKGAVLKMAVRLSETIGTTGVMGRDRSEFAEVLQGEEGPDAETLTIILDELETCGGSALNLHGTKIRDISALGGAEFLELLTLARTQIRNWEVLGELVRLRWLRVDGSNIPSLDPLRGLLNLEMLSSVNTSVQDVSPLAQLTKLKYIHLNNTEVSDIDAFRHMKGLEVVDVSGSNVEDMSPLTGAVNIKRVNASSTALTDMEWARELVSLEALDLRDTDVQDIEPLEGLLGLRRLVLWNTRVKDLEPIAEMKQLNYLDLDGMEVNDFRPLAKLRNLRTLYMQDVEGAAEAKEELQGMLPECSIFVEEEEE